jgi:four helix bundle protein
MKSCRDLKVWQKSMKLAKSTYELTNKFPKHETYGLRQQIRRSVISVPCNLVEGYGRYFTKEYKRFIQIARASLFEFQTQIELSISIGYVKNSEVFEIIEESIQIEKMLNSLISRLSDTGAV